MRLSLASVVLGVVAWLLIGLGGHVFNEYTAGQITLLAGGLASCVALGMGIRAFRERERWVSSLAIGISAYPGVAFPLLLVAASFGGIG